MYRVPERQNPVFCATQSIYEIGNLLISVTCDGEQEIEFLFFQCHFRAYDNARLPVFWVHTIKLPRQIVIYLMSASLSHRCTEPRKAFRPLDFFHILFRYSLILKCIKKYRFSTSTNTQYPIMTSQYPIMTKQKQVFRNVCKCKKNKKTLVISHLHKYSGPLLSTLLKY